ncbi:MAG: hypothetical protein NTW55_02575 [Planctomycetota bacterium]|nr:hypothetical protein [Planctomycetota bacterium]
MNHGKVFSWWAVSVIAALLITAGCIEPSKETTKPQVEPEKKTKAPKQLLKEAAKPVAMALKFSPQESTDYRAITEAQDCVKFEGSMPDNADLKDKKNLSRAEMVFTQQIQSVNNNGNAVANITIKGLKYLLIYKNDTVIDFDSAREQANPLIKLIGQSYTIEIAPTGEVVRVDVNQAKAAVAGLPSGGKAVSEVLDAEAIKERHGRVILPAAEKKMLSLGQSWSNLKVFSFRMMGEKSYEKIYTLNGVSDVNNRQVAVVDMNAIPSSQTEGKEPSAAAITKMFDSTGTYSGRLMMDTTNGKVENYSENLQSEWIIVDPSVKQTDSEEPTTLKMQSIRVYSIEKIN